MPRVKRVRKYWYIGDPSRVTPCHNLGTDNAPACDDGSCPGEIDGYCRFLNGEPAGESASALFVKYNPYKIIPISELAK